MRVVGVNTSLGILESHHLGVGKGAEREFLLQITMEPNSYFSLIYFKNPLGIKVERETFIELEGQEQGMPYLVTNIRR
jgi:hypothetical protein